MDRIIERFFPGSEPARAEFKFDHRPATYAYADCRLKVEDRYGPVGKRPFFMTQGFTPIGFFDAETSHPGTYHDGINVDFMNQDDTLSVEALFNELNTNGGYDKDKKLENATLLWNHIWGENQVALLVNMLRYLFLRKVEECRGSLDGGFGDYDDGHVKIDMDQWMQHHGHYKPRAHFKTWPCSPISEAEPFSAHRIDGFMPTTEGEALDLTGLEYDQAQFVLLMCRQWNRRSRFRADFDYKQLTPVVHYRYPIEVHTHSLALFGTTELPPMISSDDGWRGLITYVQHNRLYGAFSVALNLFASIPYHFRPSAAEATLWASLRWTVRLPDFRASRGWFEAFNRGIPAIIDKVCLAEWKYFSRSFETINLLCLTWIQAVQTGLAVRSIRRGLEHDPEDLMSTELNFKCVETQISAAASEAMRIPVPSPRYVDTYVSVDLDTTKVFDRRVIPTVYPWEEGKVISGYDIRPVEIVSRATGWVNIPIGEVTDEIDKEGDIRAKFVFDEEFGKMKKKQIEVLKRNNPRAVVPTMSPAERLAADGLVRVREAGVVKTYVIGVVAPRTIMAGVPVYILPIKAFPYPTPFDMRGTLTPGRDEFYPSGAWLDPIKAWNFGHLARLSGFDIHFRPSDPECKADVFFSPNFVNFVWPVLMKIDGPRPTLKFERQVVRPPKRIMRLPDMVDSSYLEHEVRYDISVVDRGTAGGNETGRVSILKTPPGDDNAVREYVVRFETSMTLKLTAAWVTRGPRDFRFVPVVEDGTASGQPQLPDATGAIDPVLPRMPNAPATLEEIESILSTLPQREVVPEMSSQSVNQTPTSPAAPPAAPERGESSKSAEGGRPIEIAEAEWVLMSEEERIRLNYPAHSSSTNLFRTTLDFGLPTGSGSTIEQPEPGVAPPPSPPAPLEIKELDADGNPIDPGT